MPSLAHLYAGVFARAASGAVSSTARSLVNSLPGVNRSQSTGAASSVSLPHREVHVPGVELTAQRHREFCDVVHAQVHTMDDGRTPVFSAYLHALAFPAVMVVLTQRDFPLPTVGLIHLSQHVEHRDQFYVGQQLDITVRAQNMQPHRLGTTVEVVTQLHRGAREHFSGPIVWVGRSVYLARGVYFGDGEHGSSTETIRSRSGGVFSPPVPTARWRLGADTGRRYAAVSGDVNPIHMSTPTARAAGMKGVIAHGMYTVSRAVAMVDPPVPCTWSADFSAPLTLPSVVEVAVRRRGRGERFQDAEVLIWGAGHRKPYATVNLRGELLG